MRLRIPQDDGNPVNPPNGLNRLGSGILNLGPMALSGGKIAFTSNHNALVPTTPYTRPAMQLCVVDEAHIHASVRDVQGNITRLNLRFSTQLGENDVFYDGFE